MSQIYETATIIFDIYVILLNYAILCKLVNSLLSNAIMNYSWWRIFFAEICDHPVSLIIESEETTTSDSKSHPKMEFWGNYPWFMSCSVSSSQTRTCIALPSRHHWNISSIFLPLYHTPSVNTGDTRVRYIRATALFVLPNGQPSYAKYSHIRNTNTPSQRQPYYSLHLSLFCRNRRVNRATHSTCERTRISCNLRFNSGTELRQLHGWPYMRAPTVSTQDGGFSPHQLTPVHSGRTLLSPFTLRCPWRGPSTDEVKTIGLIPHSTHVSKTSYFFLDIF